MAQIFTDWILMNNFLNSAHRNNFPPPYYLRSSVLSVVEFSNHRWHRFSQMCHFAFFLCYTEAIFDVPELRYEKSSYFSP